MRVLSLGVLPVLMGQNSVKKQYGQNRSSLPSYLLPHEFLTLAEHYKMEKALFLVFPYSWATCPFKEPTTP